MARIHLIVNPLNMVSNRSVLALLVAFIGGLGAAPEVATQTPHNRGYIPDRECVECHADVADEFQDHGMARSFARPANALRVEDFDAPYVTDHRLRYALQWSNDQLLYRQWQVASDGRPIHEWQRSVDWVVGSGAASRVYLVQTAEGMLYELPIAWYTQQSGWGIKPGAVKAEGEAGFRSVSRGCIFCHNAFPSEPPVDDLPSADQIFPTTLPEGIGCQRCHGPGGEHANTAREWEARQAAVRSSGTRLTAESRRTARDTIRSTVVNPQRLSPERRRDVCAQCHHQPAVAVFGERRIGRGDLEFAAGDVLDDFLLKLEVFDLDEAGQRVPLSERFDINHHAYRLEQSLCFTASAPGRLDCTTCHDPHRKTSSSETHQQARMVCLECHQVDVDDPPTEGSLQLAEHFARALCVDCHMPRRRTQDVPDVVMTDHRIQRFIEPEEQRLAREFHHTLTGVHVQMPNGDPDPKDPLERLAKARAQHRGGFGGALDDYAAALADARRVFPDQDLSQPALELGRAYVKGGRSKQARPVLEPLLDHPPTAVRAAELLAVALSHEGDYEAGLALFDRAIDAGAEDATADQYFNRGLFRIAVGHHGACQDFDRAVKRNELLVRGWLYLGHCRRTVGDKTGAVQALSTALALEPGFTRAVGPLLELLAELGRHDEAQRLREHHAVGG